ncbi:four helix bundle protein [Fulvivirgaceae bacterium BMA12]|uniref:Four helix bundle protein n=1 Tax=Agaribacillus aureus TaxID=3051825 RepID=A0ABT8LF16_9BACT|nr:four helix bundle protein [Fulvivirgaceae bacterium BMA12]
MFDFQKLEVYAKAKTFNSSVQKLLQSITHVNSSNKNQLQRAAFSIMLNIAEGSGRFTKPDKKNFYVIARGSTFECVAILDFWKDENIISEDQFSKLYCASEELSKMLFALIKKLGS